MTLSSKEVAALKAAAQELSSALQMGKSGITDGFVAEVRAHLEREPLVKVKMLAAAREAGDRKALATELAESCGATLIEVRGNTAVLYKPKGRRRVA